VPYFCVHVLSGMLIIALDETRYEVAYRILSSKYSWILIYEYIA